MPQTPVCATVDRTRIEQILVNLVGNAADALGGVPSNRRRIRIGLLEEAGTVVLHIEDTGTGIPADKLDAIFEPYYTTKPVGKGTGLGLPVVKQLVEDYRGRIAVMSTVGEGTRFTVTLPASGAEKAFMASGAEAAVRAA